MKPSLNYHPSWVLYPCLAVFVTQGLFLVASLLLLAEETERAVSCSLSAYLLKYLMQLQDLS